MALGLGLFALAILLAIGMGWLAASNARSFDETQYVSVVLSNGKKNGHGR